MLPALLLLTDYYFITPFQFTAIRSNLKLYVPIAVAGAFGVDRCHACLQTRRDGRIRDQGVHLVRVSVHAVPRDLAVSAAVCRSRRPECRLRVPDLAFAFWMAARCSDCIGLLALAVVAWRYRREFPLASFGYFGFLLLLAPTSSFVPIRDVAVERRLYLPFICLLLITVDLLRRWKTSRMVMAGSWRRFARLRDR